MTFFKYKKSFLFFISLFLMHISYALVQDNKQALTFSVKKDAKLAVLVNLVTNIMEQRHYLRKKVDNNLSETLFKEFFTRLDPNKYFFLQSDIDKLQIYRYQLDNMLKVGNAKFAFIVFNIFIKRLDERLAFVKSFIDKPLDFTKDEYISLDRKDVEWVKTETEMNDLWRKILKNKILSYQLLSSSILEDKEKNKKLIKDNKLFPQPPPKERVSKYYERIDDMFKEYDKMDVLEVFLTAFARIYDPHSSYMSPDTLEDFNISMRLSLEGIGAMLRYIDGYTKVEKIILGGPAEKDGRLKSGDRIIAVAQNMQAPVDVIEMPLDRTVRLIRGKKGTRVVLTVIKGDKGLGSSPEIIDIVRDKVNLKESEAKGIIKLFSRKEISKTNKSEVLKNYRIGVIELPSFYLDFEGRRKGLKDYRSTTRDVLAILEKMKKEKIDGLILDLRGNGGGSLLEAINLTGLFFPKGPVVQVSSGHGTRPRVNSDNDGKTYYDGPLLIEVNRLSASASEILTAAIQDCKRGVVIGDITTHGKGTVQTIAGLDRFFRNSPRFRGFKSGALKYTIQKFYRINGASTQLKGVTPDIIFPSYSDNMELGEKYLEHALKWDTVKKLELPYKGNITQFIPELRAKSIKRRNHNTKFIELIKDIADYKKKQKDAKKLTLNKEKRIAQQKKLEKNIEKRKKLLGLSEDDDKKNDDDKVDPTVVKVEKTSEKDDIYELEGYNIISDLIELSNTFKK